MARESKRKRDEQRFGRPERLADVILGTTRREDWRLFKLGDPDAFAADKDYHWSSIDNIMSTIGDSPVFDVSNVSDYFWGCDKEQWTRKDFPNVFPPFDQFFMEASPPSSISGQENQLIGHHGVLFHSRTTLSDGRSVIAMTPLFLSRDGHPGYFGATGIFAVDDQGEIVVWPKWSFVRPREGTSPRTVTEFFGILVQPFWLAISFMHCKNVVATQLDPPKELNRARARAGLRPFVRFHTIDIDPMKKILRTEGGSDDVGVKKAMHICRGHFKRRKTGTFWWSAHVRGSGDEGLVISDYRVKPSGES